MEKMTRRVLIGVGVGIGVAASSAALYFLLKPEVDSLDDYLGVRTSRQTVVRVRIRKDAIGSVIGRGGEVIKRIQSQTKTRINFEDEKETGSGSEQGEDIRFAVIRGSPENVLDAENKINTIIANQPLLFKEDIFIPCNAVGCVIGRNGDTIRYLCDISGAKITVARLSETPRDGHNPVTIQGTAEQIVAAKSMIDEKLAESEIRQQKFRLNAGTRGVRYKARSLAIEGDKNGTEDETLDYLTEELVASSDNGQVEVYVSAVNNPGNFWVQIFGTKGIQLDRMSDEISDFYEIPENRESTKLKEVKVGDIIAAPYKHDANWYRVRVVRVEEEGYSPEETPVTVYYLDFGDEASHPRKDLCSLNPEFVEEMPFQAIECSLAGVQPKDSAEWPEAATKYFSELTYAAQWTNVLAKPVKKVSKPNEKERYVTVVELVDVHKEEDVNVAKALIAKGLAVESSEEVSSS